MMMSENSPLKAHSYAGGIEANPDELRVMLAG